MLFLREQATSLDFGLSLPLQRLAKSRGGDSEMLQRRFLTSSSVQEILEDLFIGSAASTMNVERKHVETKRNEVSTGGSYPKPHVTPTGFQTRSSPLLKSPPVSRTVPRSSPLLFLPGIFTAGDGKYAPRVTTRRLFPSCGRPPKKQFLPPPLFTYVGVYPAIFLTHTRPSCASSPTARC